MIVFTLQDNWQNPSPPTDNMTFTQYGIRDFSVQGWDGTQWVTLGTVAANNLVKRNVTFSPFATNKIRVNVTNALSAWSPLRMADFDGDARSDILWQGTDGSVSMWMMNGRTSASRVQVMGPNTNWTVTHTADFNGDGKADLVWLGRDGTIGTWLMNGGTVLEKRTQFAAGTGWSCTVAEDMSGDGKADIIWSNTNGAVGDWLMDGTTNISRAPLEPAGSTNKVVPLQFHH